MAAFNDDYTGGQTPPMTNVPGPEWPCVDHVKVILDRDRDRDRDRSTPSQGPHKVIRDQAGTFVAGGAFVHLWYNFDGFFRCGDPPETANGGVGRVPLYTDSDRQKNLLGSSAGSPPSKGGTPDVLEREWWGIQH